MNLETISLTSSVKPRLFIDAQHGLANRLRAIASAYSIAKQADYELVIVWRPDHHCGCHMSDLFEYPGIVISDGFADLYRGHAHRFFNYMEVEEGARFQAPIFIQPEFESGDIYVRSAYTLNSPLRRFDDEQRFLKGLVPSRSILELIGQVDHPSDVSVHIRMATGPQFDHLPHESPENWPEGRHEELIKWRADSHSSRFFKRIDALIEENNADTIFLAADLEETYKLFENRYGKRTRYLPRDLFDRSDRQLQYALADALLLTKTKRFLGSTGSSFSDIVARLIDGKCPVEQSGVDF
ncbi:hypothetical protein [uncultured Shimia sp.]|uniref:hypothetical protein n=1 Tax=uncultured Shimia sp. TaxID=573152 RepID=UPI00260EEFF3|nr:hypothetical protein [uncultured Shimia sp.]